MTIKATYTPPPQQHGTVTLEMPLNVAVTIRALLGACNGIDYDRSATFSVLDEVVREALNVDEAPRLYYVDSNKHATIDLCRNLYIK